MKLIHHVVRAVALSAGLAGGAAFAQEQGAAPPPPAVTVVTLDASDVTLSSTLPGRVIASAEAELRPQVNGIVIERTFDEGTTVSEGDALYRIDPRSYEAAVAQAEAALAQAQATAAAAVREADRVGALRDRSVASQQTEDTAIAQRDSAEAAVEAAQAALDAAKIDLDRTTIRAPLDGVIGLALTTQGQLVTASQTTAMAVIRRIDPVQVDVTQSAADIIRWQRSGGQASLPEGVDRTVTLRLADGTEYDHTGSLTAAEPHVDESTGVVTLRMEFANPDNLLLPGMYVLADIPQAELKGVILAPQEGVTRDRRGRPIAYIVNAENTVEERSLDIVQDHGNAWVVREGLAPGDRLIVEGLQRVAPGAPVTPEERSDDAADGQAAPAAGDAGAAAGGEQAQAPADAGASADAGAADAGAAEGDPAPAEPAAAPADAGVADAAGEAGAAGATETAPAAGENQDGSGN
ncbi:efflux RND transporter periplasmic adaptor subunit [Paracoccus aurantiacus]|uniref:efflux RND transporter periplasmic adaptor subunit n=1 Tax=Paracoccus aurantiacus TaxID=2599412 RepID=UPI003643E400